MRVHLATAPDEAALAALRAQIEARVELSFGPEPPMSADYEVLVAGRPSEALLDASPRLRLVVVPFAGLPEPTRQRLLARPALALHNLHHNAAPTAELAVALLLAAAKRIVPADRALRAGDWSPRYADDGAVLLAGKTALVLGLGAVGTGVARACRGLGMRVLAVRRRPGAGTGDGVDAARETDTADEIHTLATLPALLPRADALLVCLPLTPETSGLIGSRELALLPARAVLVNIARGPVIDEAALYAALAGGRLHAAGLDVWWRYPGDADRRAMPPSDLPFHLLDNVVMSPHRAGHVAETESLRMTHLATLLNAAARGAAVPNRVDPAAGY